MCHSGLSSSVGTPLSHAGGGGGIKLLPGKKSLRVACHDSLGVSCYMLPAQSFDPALDSLSPSLSAPPPLVLCLSLSLKNK